jgi:hypothetical protein
MRQGLNPGKVNSALPPFRRHRVIVPVFIPELAGYFAGSLEVLRLMLDSLALTLDDRASLTVVANGCAPVVLAELQRRQLQGDIDQLIVNAQNRGKVDAIVATARASFEPLITIADCDVLFCPGWIDAVEEVFCAFPECGFVSPSPNPGLAFSHTASTLITATLKRVVRVGKVVSDEDLDRFAESVGNRDWFKPAERRAQLFVERQQTHACIGAGHFVFTVRQEVVEAMPVEPALHALKVGAENAYLDEPPDRLGVWRLATTRAYAYHMGNIPEPWMHETLACFRAQGHEATIRDVPPLHRSWVAVVPWRIRQRLAGLLRRWVSPRLQTAASLAAATE